MKHFLALLAALIVTVASVAGPVYVTAEIRQIVPQGVLIEIDKISYVGAEPSAEDSPDKKVMLVGHPDLAKLTDSQRMKIAMQRDGIFRYVDDTGVTRTIKRFKFIKSYPLQ